MPSSATVDGIVQHGAMRKNGVTVPRHLGFEEGIAGIGSTLLDPPGNHFQILKIVRHEEGQQGGFNNGGRRVLDRNRRSLGPGGQAELKQCPAKNTADKVSAE